MKIERIVLGKPFFKRHLAGRSYSGLLFTKELRYAIRAPLVKTIAGFGVPTVAIYSGRAIGC